MLFYSCLLSQAWHGGELGSLGVCYQCASGGPELKGTSVL